MEVRKRQKTGSNGKKMHAQEHNLNAHGSSGLWKAFRLCESMDYVPPQTPPKRLLMGPLNGILRLYITTT